MQHVFWTSYSFMYVQFVFCFYRERLRWNHVLVKNTFTKLEFFHKNNCLIDLKGAWKFNLSSFFFLCNSFHNNSGFYKVLVHVLFTTSKTELVSTVRNLKYVFIIPLKTKTILSTSQNSTSQHPSFPHLNKSSTLALKKNTLKKNSPSVLSNFAWFLKGNPNFSGILNWILQILHYHCNKHKNVERLRFIKQNIIFFCFLWHLCLFRLSQQQILFISWTLSLSWVLSKILNVISEHSCRCIKNRFYNTFNLCYFVSSSTESLYKSHSSSNIN